MFHIPTTAQGVADPAKVRSARWNPRPKISGFTLMELLVVMGFLSLLLTVTLPRLSRWSSEVNDRNAAVALTEWILHLKRKAIADQRKVKLWVDLDADRFWTEDGTPAGRDQGDSFTLPATTDLREVLYPGHPGVVSGRTELLFYANGISDQALLVFAPVEKDPWALRVEPFLVQVTHLDPYETP